MYTYYYTNPVFHNSLGNAKENIISQVRALGWGESAVTDPLPLFLMVQFVVGALLIA